MLTLMGLALDLIGVILVGWIFPVNAVLVVGSAEPAAKGILGKIAKHGGWTLIAAGFLLQFIGRWQEM